MRLLDIGIKGDINAINSILDRIERLFGSERQEVETSDEDIEILQRVLAKRNFSGLTDAVQSERHAAKRRTEKISAGSEDDRD